MPSINEIFERLSDVLIDQDISGDLDFVPPDDAIAGFRIESNCLAVDVQILPLLYQHAWLEFVSARKTGTIESLIRTTSILVMVNPDCYSAWNARRTLIITRSLETLREMEFTRLLVTKHPKSSILWSHRHWVRHRIATDDPSAAISDDTRLISTACDRYKKNYAAWTYRTRVFVHTIEYISSELIETESWCKSHISDYSGWHYRQFLFSKLHRLSGPSERLKSLLESERLLIHDLIDLCPGHESLWYHLRFIFLSSGRWIGIDPLKSLELKYNATKQHGLDEPFAKVYQKFIIYFPTFPSLVI